MTLDGFLSFLALFIAFYAVVSPVTRLRAQLHLTVQIPLALVAVSLVFYFEFFSILGLPCQLQSARACAWLTFPTDNSFTPAQAAFLTVFAWMIIAFGLNVLLKPGPRALKNINKIVQTLLYEHRFAELLDFVRPHLRLIEAAAERQLLWQKTHDWLANANWLSRLQIRELKPGGVLWENEQPSSESIGKRGYETFRRRIRWTRHFVPDSHKTQELAESIVRVLLRSDELRRFLVTMRPDALPDLLSIKLQPRFEFSDKVLRDLIADKGSRLYQEIEENRNIADNGCYAIPDDNVLLKFFFGNAEEANTLGVWKPVGDATINAIRMAHQSGYDEYLNEPNDGLDVETWRDITFVSIRFFDIMVKAAMVQSVPYHMWLFYMPRFVTELEKIYDTSNNNVDTEDEFPTRSARLMYEVFNAMGDWIQNLRYLDKASPHAAIKGKGVHPSSVIPADAALALGDAMMTVALSNRIGDSFARYLHECVLRDIDSLSRTGLEGEMRTILIRAVLAGGNRSPGRRYGERLKTFVAKTDYVLRNNVNDYVETLNATYP